MEHSCRSVISLCSCSLLLHFSFIAEFDLTWDAPLILTLVELLKGYKENRTGNLLLETPWKSRFHSAEKTRRCAIVTNLSMTSYRGCTVLLRTWSNNNKKKPIYLAAFMLLVWPAFRANCVLWYSCNLTSSIHIIQSDFRFNPKKDYLGRDSIIEVKCWDLLQLKALHFR